jgi:hypothetical protein
VPRPLDAGHVGVEMAEHVVHGRGGARSGRVGPHRALEQAGGAHEGQHQRLVVGERPHHRIPQGKAADVKPSGYLDHITSAPLTTGHRAELPSEVAAWMIEPLAVMMCDPFAGSRALVRAATAAGMDAICIEKNPVDAGAVEFAQHRF